MMMLIKVKGSVGTKSEKQSIDSDLVRVHWEVQYFISENSTYVV